jgi:hypothetical protein
LPRNFFVDFIPLWPREPKKKEAPRFGNAGFPAIQLEFPWYSAEADTCRSTRDFLGGDFTRVCVTFWALEKM